MKFKAVVCLLLIAVLAFSGCGGGGGGGNDSTDDNPQPSRLSKQDARDTIIEFSARVELLKTQYLGLITGNFTQEIMTNDPETFSPYYQDGSPVTVYDAEGKACTVEDADCDAARIYEENYAIRFTEFMDNRDALLEMQDETEAAFKKLGLGGLAPSAAGMVQAQGVKDWLYEKTWFGNGDRKTLASTITYIIQNDEGSQYTEQLWKDIQASGYDKGAEDLDVWLGKLDKGELDASADEIYNELYYAEYEEEPYFGEAARGTGNSAGTVVARNGAKAINVTYEVGKVVAETYIPGVGLVTKTFDGIQKWNNYYQKIKEGKIKDVAKEIIIDKVTSKLTDFGENKLEASRFGKKVNHAIATTKEKYDNLKKVNDILKKGPDGDDSSNVSGVTVADKSPSENPDREDGTKRASLVVARPTARTLADHRAALSQASYDVLTYVNEEGNEVTTDIPDDSEDGYMPDVPEIIAGLMADSDFFDIDLGLEDFALALEPGVMR